jgi:hypothetical protein
MSDPSDLPTLDDMHDTLMFVWRTFFDQLEELWRSTPGTDLKTSWGGEPVRMRYRALPDTGAGGLEFIELQIGDGNSEFVARGIFTTPSSNEQANEPIASVEWSSTGDYEAFIAWMVPWVSRVINEGHGWIEVP